MSFLWGHGASRRPCPALIFVKLAFQSDKAANTVLCIRLLVPASSEQLCMCPLL